MDGHTNALSRCAAGLLSGHQCVLAGGGKKIAGKTNQMGRQGFVYFCTGNCMQSVLSRETLVRDAGTALFTIARAEDTSSLRCICVGIRVGTNEQDLSVS